MTFAFNAPCANQFTYLLTDLLTESGLMMLKINAELEYMSSATLHKTTR